MFGPGKVKRIEEQIREANRPDCAMLLIAPALVSVPADYIKDGPKTKRADPEDPLPELR